MSLSRAAKAALQQAETEGLTLLRSERRKKGYKCVVSDSRNSKARNEGRAYATQVSRQVRRVFTPATRPSGTSRDTPRV